MWGMIKFILLLLLLTGTALLYAQDPGAVDTLLASNTYAAIDDSLGGQIRIKIIIKTDNTGIDNDIAVLTIPLVITNSNPAANPVLSTNLDTAFANSAVAGFTEEIFSLDGPADSFPVQVTLGAFQLFPGIGLTAGDHLFATLVISLSETTTICLDTFSAELVHLYFTTNQAADYVPFWQPYCVTVTTYPPGEPPAFIDADSPVNLIVIAPDGDSIGVNFNTYDSAFYDIDEDSISIYSTVPGKYLIRVELDPSDTSGETSYSIDARMDGTDQVALVTNAPLPEEGQSQQLQITNDPTQVGCLAKAGNVNGLDPISSADIVYLVSYVFDKDRPATGCTDPDPGTCWPLVPECIGEVNGIAPVTSADIVYLVNYVFDKDRPATSCIDPDPGTCWPLIQTESCCL